MTTTLPKRKKHIATFVDRQEQIVGERKAHAPVSAPSLCSAPEGMPITPASGSDPARFIALLRRGSHDRE